MGTDQHPAAEPVPVTLARLEGKLDTYAAGNAARLDELTHRIDSADTRIKDLTSRVGAVEVEQAARRPRVSGWQAAAVILAGLGIVTGVMTAVVGWLVQRL